jgi:hypothetical protein
MTKTKAQKVKTKAKSNEADIGTQTKPASGKNSIRPPKPATIHVREFAKKDSDTLCGGSHSKIWHNARKAGLTTVGPQQASKGTCGRCRRVAVARELV